MTSAILICSIYFTKTAMFGLPFSPLVNWDGLFAEKLGLNLILKLDYISYLRYMSKHW